MASAAMIAQQVAAKSTRDTLFLSHFDVSRWPTMLAWSSVVSIAVAWWASRVMARTGPRRLMPAACVASAVLLLGIAALEIRQPAAAGVLLFLHVAAVGPVLISGFWSMFNEHFDPRTAKHEIGRIGTVGTLGGLIGGVLANRVAAAFGVGALIPVLAGLHVLCAFALQAMGRGVVDPPRAVDSDDSSALAGLALLARRPYLRNLGLLLLLATVAATLLDYVFRRFATRSFSGNDLMRVFSWFHTAAALLSFLLQIASSRLRFDRLRPVATVASLPVTVAASSFAVLLFPGLISSAIARALEMVVSNSIFRSGFELMFTPVAPIEKRSTKALIDVGMSRVGDFLGGWLTLIMIAIAGARVDFVLLAGAVALSLLALAVTLRLHPGYVGALAHGVREGTEPTDANVGVDMSQTLDSSTLAIALDRLPPAARPAESNAAPPDASPAIAPAEPPPLPSPADREADLRSGDPTRVRRALADAEPLPSSIVPHVIPLLADDALARDATRALRRVAAQVTGQMVDALLDPEQAADVRRRIPRILASSPSERAVEGLLRGLDDVRFRVRLQCGWALARIREGSPEIPIDARRVVAAVLSEVEVEKHLWGGKRDMERLEDASDSPFVDDFVRERANASLQHVFTLLSVALSEQTLLRIAFNGLHSGDTRRRGTALEYLDCVLPAEIKDPLWPYLEERGRPRGPTRTREEIIADLVETTESMRINIAELRKLEGGAGGP